MTKLTAESAKAEAFSPSAYLFADFVSFIDKVNIATAMIVMIASTDKTVINAMAL